MFITRKMKKGMLGQITDLTTAGYTQQKINVGLAGGILAVGAIGAVTSSGIKKTVGAIADQQAMLTKQVSDVTTAVKKIAEMIGDDEE